MFNNCCYFFIIMLAKLVKIQTEEMNGIDGRRIIFETIAGKIEKSVVEIENRDSMQEYVNRLMKYLEDPSKFPFVQQSRTVLEFWIGEVDYEKFNFRLEVNKIYNINFQDGVIKIEES